LNKHSPCSLSAGEAYLLVMEAGGLELRDVSLKIKHNATQTTTRDQTHAHQDQRSCRRDCSASATAEIATEARMEMLTSVPLVILTPYYGLTGFTLKRTWHPVNQRDAVSADPQVICWWKACTVACWPGCSMEDVLHAAPDVLQDRSFIMSVPDSLDSARNRPPLSAASGRFVVTVKKQANK
jgi:hypothetical protein